MKPRYYQGLHQLSNEQASIASKLATDLPEDGFETRPGDRYGGTDRVQEVARVMVEGCMMDRYTFGCLSCIFFDTGRSICTDVLKEEIDRL